MNSEEMQEERGGQDSKRNGRETNQAKSAPAHPPQLFYTADYTRALILLIRRAWSRRSRLTPLLMIVLFLCGLVTCSTARIIRGKSLASFQTAGYISTYNRN